MVALTSMAAAKSGHENGTEATSKECTLSPRETKGPLANKTPAEYVRSTIIGDRKGIALLITMTILNKNDNCKPLKGALVDVWHCDSRGNYSEYGGYGMQPEDLTQEHFLRGRQTTDLDGRVTFISIFPGYYPGRAPHIHLKVINKEGMSLLASQIAFPENVCNAVYSTDHYQGTSFTLNSRDGVFRNSLEGNRADAVTGNISDGYVLIKSIVIDA